MSKIFAAVAATSIIYFAVVDGLTMSHRYGNEGGSSRCNAKVLVRAGQMVFIPEHGAWVSLRGEVFPVGDCPALERTPPATVSRLAAAQAAGLPRS
jgi:hypothetical protein